MPIGISSDPILIDKDRHQLFYCIQETWHIYGNFLSFCSYTLSYLCKF